MHALSISWWIGALFPLALFLKLERRLASPPLIRFSRYIPYAIAPLVLSGVVLAVLQLGSPGAAWLSPYGMILAIKLILVLVLFAVASWNRWVLTAPAAAGKQRAVSHMRKGIAAEIILTLMILALVSAWRFTPPPRALAAQAPVGIALLLATPEVKASMIIEDTQVGMNDITVRIEGADNATFSPRSVRITMRPPGSLLAPVAREADHLEQNLWQTKQFPLPLPGVWTIQIDVRVTDWTLLKTSPFFGIRDSLRLCDLQGADDAGTARVLGFGRTLRAAECRW